MQPAPHRNQGRGYDCDRDGIHQSHLERIGAGRGSPRPDRRRRTKSHRTKIDCQPRLESDDVRHSVQTQWLSIFVMNLMNKSFLQWANLPPNVAVLLKSGYSCSVTSVFREDFNLRRYRGVLAASRNPDPEIRRRGGI